MFNTTVTRIGAAVVVPNDPCAGVAMPNVVGKTVKEMKRETVKISGKQFTAISLVLSDGTKVLAGSFTPGSKVPKDPGIFVVADANGCAAFTVA